VLYFRIQDVDYVGSRTENVTAVKDESAIVFYNMSALSDSWTLSTGHHRPIVLSSRSPLFNYRICLEEMVAKAGDYVPIVVVKDRAYNAVRFILSEDVTVV
jgi:hypothetical protein